MTLYPSKIKHALLLLISLVFVAIGFLMINGNNWIGWFIIGVFGLGVIVPIISLLPNATYLKLSDQGVETRTLFKSHLFPWKDIAKFEVGHVGLNRYFGSNKMVVFDFSPNYQGAEKARKALKSMCGFEGTLPGSESYKKSPKELAEILNEWKAKYS